MQQPGGLVGVAWLVKEPRHTVAQLPLHVALARRYRKAGGGLSMVDSWQGSHRKGDSAGFWSVCEDRAENGFMRDLQEKKVGCSYGNKKQVNQAWGEVKRGGRLWPMTAMSEGLA